jgi:hypothetical protein
MTLALLQFKPGIVKDITEYSAGKNGPYWIDGNNVRFRNGYPTKIGGWENDPMFGINAADGANYLNTNQVHTIGVPRNLNYWRALDGEDYLSIGTHNHLMILVNQALYDITPLRNTATNINNNPFATVDTSTTVTVTDTSHGADDGDYVRFKQATATNGITADELNRHYGYQITYIDPNTYTIQVPNAATGTGSGGGSGVDAEYLIGKNEGLGTQTAAPALGWGTGGWGLGTWGTPRTGSTTVLENSEWSLNLWGEDLIATVLNHGIYYWDTSASSGAMSRAVLVSSLGGASDVPTKARLTTVSFPDRHLVCGGSNPLGGSNIDPMLVRWSDQEDFTNWTPSATNTAGDQRLEVGTKIVAMTPTRDETFISTDEAVYGMSFVGPPFTFAFRLLATNCGAVGKNVVMNVDGDIYWMGKRNFFFYNGAVQEIPCPVRYFVFDRLQTSYITKSFAAHNKRFNEVTWFYVSSANTNTSGNPEPDSYVTYNYETNSWSLGSIPRTCWFDSFGFRTNPFAFDSVGYLYDHEVGTDDNGQALSAYIESSPAEIASGDALMLVDKIIPDATIQGELNITIESQRYPNASVVTKGPFTIDQNSTKVSMRTRGRQMSMKLESTGLGDTWSLGDFRVNMRTDGMR